MKDLLRLLTYARRYVGRLVMAFICAALASVLVLGLVSLVQPLVNDVMRLAPSEPVAQEAAAEAAAGDDDATGKFDALSLADRFLGGEGWVTRYSSWARRLVGEGGNTTFLALAVLILVLYVLKAVFTYFGTYYVRYVGLWIILDLRTDLYTRIHQQGLPFFSKHPTGLLMSRVKSDVSRLGATVSTDLADILRLGCIIVGQMVWVFYLNWKLSAFCVVLLPLVLTPVVRFGKKLKKTSRLSQERTADMTVILKESFTSIRVVKAFGMEAYEVGRFRRVLKKLLHQQLRAARLLSLTPPLMEIIGALAASILISYAGYNIARNTLNPGEFTSFLTAMVWLYASFKNLAKINNSVQQALAAARRVFEMMDVDLEIQEEPGARALPAFSKEIAYNDVTFGYDERPVLRGVNLKVHRGQTVAIVGSSGAGKTTLLDLLPRFYDVDSGSVTIDGNDIRNVTLASLRSQIGIVTQEILLFDDTVRDNIAYGRENVPQAEIEAAARVAFAHDFIMRLPKGYDTDLGESGHRLSVGERQRISVARALLKNSPILILDEATSALDTESEAMVQRALNNLMEGRTVFVIAHRLSTVRNAHVIVVLEEGRIVEEGTHETLLERGGAYSRFYEMQFRDDAPASG